ncbi:MAG: hypothetical protein AB7E81_02520 [Hyphomicrobiaceae bacterium]
MAILDAASDARFGADMVHVGARIGSFAEARSPESLDAEVIHPYLAAFGLRMSTLAIPTRHRACFAFRPVSKTQRGSKSCKGIEKRSQLSDAWVQMLLGQQRQLCDACFRPPLALMQGIVNARPTAVTGRSPNEIDGSRLPCSRSQAERVGAAECDGGVGRITRLFASPTRELRVRIGIGDGVSRSWIIGAFFLSESISY